jgi:hypothetical protein
MKVGRAIIGAITGTVSTAGLSSKSRGRSVAGNADDGSEEAGSARAQRSPGIVMY